MLITFEGLPGAGKTTQTRLLADCLRRQGRTVVTLDDLATLDTDPVAADLVAVLATAGDPYLRGSDPVVDTLLTAAIRADLVATVLATALDAAGPDGIVIEDRGENTMSSYALAGLLHRTRTSPDAALQWLTALTGLTGRLPGRVLWLRTPVDIATRRTARRGPDRQTTAEHRAYLNRVDHAYERLAAGNPDLDQVHGGNHEPAHVHKLVHHALDLPDNHCPHSGGDLPHPPGTAS
ncbi:dTMP kinase [Lentzea atacamensis]|uniref:Thymidylate kinase n=1 Tax=Lentzea atacamensis TaxID=531938 RepID=A0ABX9DW93_9PSEU|nr:dTMP kinase [Lentzea atacamensis]RAS59427.1 dTMP kinase [Lentzea atacamensis]